MKKYLKLLIFSVFMILITGCGIKRADDIIEKFEKKLNKVNIISNKIDFQDKFKFSIYSKNHNNSV